MARAYAPDIHEARERSLRFHPLRWFFQVFPAVFRTHGRAFLLSLLITLLGCASGVALLSVDREAKSVLLPFSRLQMDPGQRVAQEEKEGAVHDRLKGVKATFSAGLMTHNARVSLFTFALGLTWGIGTAVFLFFNGVLLGAVAFDYAVAGQGTFVLGWLLPHGVIEIPAMLIAGQAGFVLAGALIGWGTREPMRRRLRRIIPDLVTLVGGITIMLVWAGIVEAFFSQYHEPVLPYKIKISFGALELCALTILLGLSGRFKEVIRGKSQ